SPPTSSWARARRAGATASFARTARVIARRLPTVAPPPNVADRTPSGSPDGFRKCTAVLFLSFHQHAPLRSVPGHCPAGMAALAASCDPAFHRQSRYAVLISGSPISSVSPLPDHVHARLFACDTSFPWRATWQSVAGAAPHGGAPTSGQSNVPPTGTGGSTTPPFTISTTGSRSSRPVRATRKTPPAARPRGGARPPTPRL